MKMKMMGPQPKMVSFACLKIGEQFMMNNRADKNVYIKTTNVVINNCLHNCLTLTGVSAGYHHVAVATDEVIVVDCVLEVSCNT